MCGGDEMVYSSVTEKFRNFPAENGSAERKTDPNDSSEFDPGDSRS